MSDTEPLNCRVRDVADVARGTYKCDKFFFQLEAQILYFNTFSYIPLYVSSTTVLIFRRTNVLLQNLVSSLSLGDCSVHRLR